MASACVNSAGMPPENFLDYPPLYPSYNWFGSKFSSSCDISDNGDSKNGDVEKPEPDLSKVGALGNLETEGTAGESFDFEFRLDDPVSKMLPADELFSDGKLVPLQVALARAEAEYPPKVPVRLQEPIKSQLGVEIAGSDDLHVFSPKAPKCSSRWKVLLGLKKPHSPKPAHQKSTLAASMAENAKSLKHFLHRDSKSYSSSSDSSMSLPLLRETDSESVSISSRLSLSSSSSGADHEDFPRPSFDFDKPNPIQISATPLLQNQPRVPFPRVKSSALECNVALRIGRNRTHRVSEHGEMPPARMASVDSPRLNASGKVIFQSLERSSSSPSTFNGGTRPRPRGMERSYSANVRVTPVLNVPVYALRGSAMSVSVFGLGQLFSPQKEKKSFNRSGNGVSSKPKGKN